MLEKLDSTNKAVGTTLLFKNLNKESEKRSYNASCKSIFIRQRAGMDSLRQGKETAEGRNNCS